MTHDLRWRERKWQLWDESRIDYIKHLYSTIKDYKQSIITWNKLGLENPQLTGIPDLIAAERKQLNEFQIELRRVVGK